MSSYMMSGLRASTGGRGIVYRRSPDVGCDSFFLLSTKKKGIRDSGVFCPKCGGELATFSVVNYSMGSSSFFSFIELLKSCFIRSMHMCTSN